MAVSADEVARQGMNYVKIGLLPFVAENMQKIYGSNWEDRSGCQFIAGKPHWDLQALLRTIIDNWTIAFGHKLPRNARGLVFELKDWRNHVPHEHILTMDDASRLLDTAARLLRIIGSAQAAALDALRIKALQAVVANVPAEKVIVEVVTDTQKNVERPAQPASIKSSSSTKQKHVLGAPAWSKCVERIGGNVGKDLTSRSGRCVFTSDRRYGVCCVVSKEHGENRFWWNIRERQLVVVREAQSSFIAFACGSADSIIVIPVNTFVEWLPTFNPKPGDDGKGWHVHVLNESGKWWILQSGRNNRIDVTKYLV